MDPPVAEASPPQINALHQWWALTSRGVFGIVRNGEIVFAIIAPAFLAVCFYIPLRSMMDSYPGMDYAQYLMPIIALQSVSFVASSSAMRSSMDGMRGINVRFRVMPMNGVVPVAARGSANAILLVISLSFATIASLVIGWRPHGGVDGTVGLYAVALSVGLLVSVIADALGLLASSPESTSQLIGLPILVLGMLSTGFVPASRFPDWIAPFARNQPVSQFSDAMRAFNDGSATWPVVAPTVFWCVGLAALAAALLFWAERRSHA
ncbi:ABC transporter permease [Gordonia insulae]|uniref:Doxorubicin resistance ABC transporter permease protein DrrB n=1 Tax=Gordonia insulae TaxID=2420509 RepID=A0A3G8JTF5_9ACTN|nr:ABC transporter permease [Gordonia insulae]AZG48347.1 Doxorubicin resistance ABC transporter permease protein DrrB [Gordonia insulae]